MSCKFAAVSEAELCVIEVRDSVGSTGTRFKVQCSCNGDTSENEVLLTAAPVERT